MRFPFVGRLVLAGLLLAVGVAAHAQEAQWQAFTDAGWRMSHGGDLATAKEYLSKGLGQAEKFPANDPRRALSLAYLASVIQRQGQADDARRYAQQALAIYDPLRADAAVPTLGKGLNALALAYHGLKDYATADRLYQKAAAVQEANRGGNGPVMARLLGNRAALLEDQGRYEEAEPLRTKQLAILDTVADPALAPEASAAQQRTGRLYRLWGRDARAEPHLLRAVELRRRFVKKGDPELADSLSDLGCLYFDLGKYDQAGAALREALLLRDVTGTANVAKQAALAESLYNLGALHVAQKDYSAAQSLLRRALAIRDAATPAGDLRTAATLSGLGAAYVGQKSYAQALSALTRALQVAERVQGDSHVDVAVAAEALAAVYVRLGDAKKAEPLLLRAVAIRESALGARHRGTAAAVNHLADFYRDQKRYADAEPLYRRALASKEKTLGRNNPALAPVLDGYALLLRQTKRADEAAKLTQRADALRAKAPAGAS
jgi:tetratricopeptide (TPR) repeat protein